MTSPTKPRTEKLRLDKLLVDQGHAASRERAQALILAGRVLVGEQRIDKPGTPISAESVIRLLGSDLKYVSRGGLKLEHALAHWSISLTGLACLDIGASTGGFTDCMLQHGAASVIAVDTGYGQIAESLRRDPRVTLLERTNARYLKPGDLAGLVGKLDQVKVIVYVDEPDLGRVALDMPVNITWDAHPGKKWSGRVNKLATEVIALGTRTVGEVSTVVDNPDHDLLPGVSVIVSITSKVVNDAVSIPRSALRTLNGATGVYKLTGKTIAWIPVAAGISDVNSVQIVSGVEPGDKVVDRIVEPADAEIRAGMRVKALLD